MTQSQLPGRVDGPADAYRHMLLAAEMRRKSSYEIAKSRLDFHERTGNQDGQTKLAETMDRNNNEIGLMIGAQAKSWEEVVTLCRHAISTGQYGNHKVIWLDGKNWEASNPKGLDGVRMKNNDPMLNWPPVWPNNQMPYLNNKYSAEPNSSISENFLTDAVHVF